MTPERWKQVKEILDAALERDPADREAFLQEACGSDAALRREVDSLIDSVPEGEVLELPAVEDAAGLFEGLERELEPAAEGRRIGAYRIVKELGRGGMGAVYLAVRHDAEFNKRAAIKILRAGMDSQEIVRRFRVERQILASLEHPYIARLLDGGSTEDGRPYIVMEYVDGTPIDAYCDRHRLTIEERLRLFQSICAAVHFAHQNLVVHRDLKPANVLVTAEGVPKLLDFGIAKLLNPELGAAALEPTRANARLMTPEYASPEQVRGETVTTASDVYSLGVLLYELLSGHRPYRVKNRSLHDVERAICEDEPTPPSAVVGLVEEMYDDAPSITPYRVSSARASTPSRLRRRLRGDLDNICLLAMRKEPQRRYRSVEQLSEDIGRALEGLPVKARRPTFAYRSSKFVRRHKLGVAAALLFVVSTLAFSMLLVRERNRARSEAAKVTAINRFLQQTLRSADPVDGLARDVTVAEALDEAAGKIGASFPDDDEIRAELQFTIGASYYRLGKYDKALALLRASSETLEKTVGPDDPNLASVLEALSHVRKAQGDTGEAVSLLARTLAIREKAYGSRHPSVADALTNLGGTYRDQGEYAKAEKALERALQILESVLGPDHPDVASTLTNLGGLHASQGRYAEAEPLFRRALEIAERALGPDHASVATILSNLGGVLVDRGEYEKAESVLLRAVSVGEKAWGPKHPTVVPILTNLGGLYLKAGRYAEAETLLARSLQIAERSNGPRHLSVAIDLNNLAGLYVERGRPGEAEPLYARALAIVEEALGPSDLFAGLLLNNLGELRGRQGRFEEGEVLCRRGLEIRQKGLPEDHLDVASSLSNLAMLLAGQGRRAEAEALYQRALEIRERRVGPDHPDSRRIRDALAELRAP